MEKKISNAFTYMFKDEDWKYKISIFTGLSFIPCLLLQIINLISKHPIIPNPLFLGVFAIFSIIILFSSIFLLIGYTSKCIQNIVFSDGAETALLPKWEDNFNNYYSIGAKKISGVILIGLALIPSVLLLGIPFLIFYILLLALDQTFCTKFKVSSYFAWKEAMNLIKANVGQYIIIILLYFIFTVIFNAVFNILFFICGSVPSFGVVSICIILESIIMAYIALMEAFLIGIIGGDYNRKKFLGEQAQELPPTAEAEA